jgi:hypothetical protein
MNIEVVQSIGLIIAFIVCGAWVWLYLKRIAPRVRQRLSEWLGVEIKVGGNAHWSAVGENATGGKDLLVGLVEIASVVFLGFAPVLVIVILTFLLLNNGK